MESNNIYLGDARQLITELPSESVDTIITDPPYGLGHNGIPFDHDLQIYYDILPSAYLALKQDAWFITFSSIKNLPDMFLYNPFTYRWQIILCIVNSVGNSLVGFNKYQACLVFSKGYPKIISRRRDAYIKHGFIANPDEGIINHPTPKPTAFLRELLYMFSKEGDVVLDPFVGGGSLPAACIQTKRQYLGFEIDEIYFKTALDRIAKVQYCLEPVQTNLFDKFETQYSFDIGKEIFK